MRRRLAKMSAWTNRLVTNGGQPVTGLLTLTAKAEACSRNSPFRRTVAKVLRGRRREYNKLRESWRRHHGYVAREISRLEDVMGIPFTQFLRPDGRRAQVTFPANEHLGGLARRLLDAGLEFHVEELSTGEVSATCFDPATGEDIAGEVCQNGPAVVGAVATMIEAAHRQRFATEVPNGHET